MRRFFYTKNSTLLITALLLTSCQPPSDNSRSAIAKTESASNKTDADLSFVIHGDTITLAPDSILSIKSSRYQPSLGLQGKVKPIQQSRFITAKDVTVQKVLVKQGQWVEKGTPLLILHHEPSPANNTTPSENQTKTTLNKQAAKPVEVSSLPTVDQSISRAANNVKADNNDNNVNAKTNSARNINPNKDSLTDDEKDSTGQKSTIQSLTPQAKTTTFTVRASFSGRVNQLPIADGEQIEADKLLLHLVDDSHLQFIATLPIEAEPQLSVGQSVNFTTENNLNKYTGQVSKLHAGTSPNELQVHVQVLKNDTNREENLKADMIVTGRVDYGQIAVGTVVPRSAIHDADLTALQKPPYQPLTPLSANVWIIKQDQRLTRQPVEIIEYNPVTEQYLIAGINNDSLICLADLPIESAGKKVIIS